MPRSPLLAGLILVAASAPARADEPTNRARADLAIKARSILKKHCGECHGPKHDASPARTGLSVLDYKKLVAPDAGRVVRFVAKDGTTKSHLLELIEAGSMPPGGRPGPTDAELKTLRDWIAARAPSYPEAFDDQTTLELILRDANSDENRADARFLRYVSFAHLITDDTVPDLGKLGWKLEQAITAARPPRKANENRPPVLTPVDDTQTLFRFDLRDLKWHTPGLFRKIDHQNQGGGEAPFTPYDLILLEYPDGFTLPDANPRAADLQTYLRAAGQARPVPFLRADWLANALLRDPAKDDPMPVREPTPLARDLISLVQLADDRSQNGPTARPFLGAAPVPTAVFADGRKPIHPFGAYYSGDVSGGPNVAKFVARVTKEKGKAVNTVAVGDLFWIEVDAPPERDMFFVVLNVTARGTVRVQPVGGGNKVTSGKPRQLRPGAFGSPDAVSGAFQIAGIDGGGDKATEHYVVIASEIDIPIEALRIVRSEHLNQPIYRFYLDTAAPLDPEKVTRRVLPVTATR